VIEVEIKGYADEDVFRRVRNNFQLIRKEYHEDTYYNHPCKDFSNTDEALRIRVRRFDGHFEAFLTYKGPKIDNHSKSRVEVEVPISDPDKHAEILRNLGFSEVLTLDKVREKYYVDKGIVIALDDVSGIGRFIEIETFAEKKEEVSGRVSFLKGILNDLGVRRFERRSYLELLLEKAGNHGET